MSMLLLVRISFIPHQEFNFIAFVLCIPHISSHIIALVYHLTLLYLFVSISCIHSSHKVTDSVSLHVKLVEDL